MYKLPKLVKRKNPPCNRPSEYKSLGAWYLEVALKYRVKLRKKGIFPSNYKLAHSILKRKLPFGLRIEAPS